jgi:hypothetical protein
VAVEASTAPSRAQRRAGALHGGRLDVRAANAGDGAGIQGAPPPAGLLHRPGRRPARPHTTGLEKRKRRREDADDVTG